MVITAYPLTAAIRGFLKFETSVQSARKFDKRHSEKSKLLISSISAPAFLQF